MAPAIHWVWWGKTFRSAREFFAPLTPSTPSRQSVRTVTRWPRLRPSNTSALTLENSSTPAFMTPSFAWLRAALVRSPQSSRWHQKTRLDSKSAELYSVSRVESSFPPLRTRHATCSGQNSENRALLQCEVLTFYGRTNAER